MLVVETCVAIAGFSGIVMVLGERQSGQWTSIDRLRLSGLLNASVLPMCMSGIALVMLASEVPSSTVWRLCSAIYAVLMLGFWGAGIRRATRLEPEETDRLHLILVIITGIAVLLLLLSNVIVMQAFWPFATGLLYQTALALYNFFGLLQRAVSDGDTD